MLRDYVRCVNFESNGNPVRALRVAAGVVLSRLKYGIGPLDYSLFGFANTPARDWGNYITDSEIYFRLIKPALDEHLRLLLSDKILFYEHCLKNALPTPAIICVVARPPRTLATGEVPYIQNLSEWKRAMESAPPELFVKPVEGAHGEGTFVVRRSGERFHFDLNTAVGSLENLYSCVVEKAQNGAALLVQQRVSPHPKVIELSSPKGLATARIVTAMMNGEARVMYACVRLPAGTNVTDNFARGTSGNLVAAADIETGRLSRAWVSARSDWPLMRSTDTHPDTGHRIKDACFPQWPEITALALQAQASLPELKSCGWDIAVTEDGVMLLEGNPHYGADILHVTLRRGLRRELTDMIGVARSGQSQPRGKFSRHPQ